MKEPAVSKINALGKTGSVLTTIAKIFCVLAIISALAGTIAVIALPKDFIQFGLSQEGEVHINLDAIDQRLSGSQQRSLKKTLEESTFETEDNRFAMSAVEVDATNITLSAEAGLKTIKPITFAPVMIVATLKAIAMFICLVFLGKLCGNLKECRTPFDNDVISSLTAFAYSLIPLAAVSTIGSGFKSGMLGGDYSFTIDVTTIFIILVILALVQIFKYGAILQQESDETL